jgi:hypothetical protein
MKSNFHIKFKPAENDNEIDLSFLGESLVGFDNVIREIVKITRIQGDISIQASSHRKGSVIIDALVNIKDVAEQLPFEKIDEFLDYLEIVNEIAWEHAKEYFGDLKNGYKSLNDYFSSHPVDLAGITIIIAILIEKAQSCKKKESLKDVDLPNRIATELHKMINRKTFRRALKPIVDDKIESIEVSSNRNFKQSAKIDQNNFQEYLGEDDTILPHLENGFEYELNGEITSLKSTRGDSLTFKHTFQSKPYNLDLLPPHGDTTKNYTDYYKEKVSTKVEVIRSSLYKKPKLRLISINLRQLRLFTKND